MKIVKVSDHEINLVVPGKGRFNIMFDDWGGDYPGVDIEYISENGMIESASKPRVMFELGYDTINPTVRIWEDKDSEDHTYDYTFDMALYESRKEN